MALSQARLKELLHYDRKTGRFTWRDSRGGRVKIGAIADAESCGRYRVFVDGAYHHASRLAVLWMTGKWPSLHIDHANGDPLDNRWVNLREATRSQNLGNARLRSDNRLGLKGVYKCPSTGRYVAKISVRRTDIWLGRFPTPHKAHRAYLAAARKHFGLFARAR